MKRRTTRGLSILLALCMMLSLLPGAVWAAWADMIGGTGILGQVLDVTTDLPPESVTATLRYDDESGDLFDVTSQCVVDSGGKFQFTYHDGGGAFPAGNFTLTFTSPYYLTKISPIQITGAGGSAIVQEYLTPGGSIFGMVTDAQTGAALAGVSVSARSGGAVKWTTATDEGGNYSLEVEAGEYTIEFSKENYQTATLTRAFGPGTKGHIGADDIQLTPGNDTGGGSGSGSGGDSGEGGDSGNDGDSGESENHWSWTLEGGVLTISGIGPMTDYRSIVNSDGSQSSASDAPWYTDRMEINKVIIENGITSIGNYAFYLCTNITDVTIPSSVISIGFSVFNGCSSLTSVTIPSSVTSIGYGAFEGCSSLTSVTIPSSVTSIGSSAFEDCSSLTSVNISSGVTSIGSNAFNGCSKLTNVTIPSSVTSIGYCAFEGCSSLTSVTIPSSVTSIGHGAFEGCSSLTSVTIPSSVTSIESGTFNNCSSLNNVIIPSSVTTIGNSAFAGCSSLTSVTIPSSVTSIGAWAFDVCWGLTDVYYAGSEENWGAINFEVGWNGSTNNVPLFNATIHYNSSGPGSGDTSETKPKVTGEATVTLAQDQIFYKNEKLAFPGGDYKGKSSFEIPVTVTITNTTTSSTTSQSELQADETLNMTVNSLTVTAPNGFNFGWFGGGSIDLKKPVTLRVGESWTGTGYIRAGTYFDQEADEWTYGIYATAETSIGQLSGYGEFTITKTTDADDDLAEDAATELIKLNIDDKVAFNAALMSALGLRGDTLEMFKQEVFTEIVMSNIPEKTLKDTLKDKITEKVMKKVFSYKEDLSVTQYHLPLKYSFNTSSYGTVILLLDCEITDFSMKGSRYGLTATINYEIVSSKKSLPVTISKSGLLGMVNYADVKTFVESAYSVATAEVKKQYNSVWGNDANKLAKLIFGDTVTKIMKAIDKSYSGIFWDLITWPAKNVKASCPINVYVYDEDGTLCGAIENDRVTTSSDDFQLSVVGETKYITGLTNDYEIKYVATGDGSMDIEVTESYGDDLVLRLVGFYDVPLHVGGEYLQSISTEFLPTVEVYQLTSENDDVISADTDEILPDDSQDESDSSGNSSSTPSYQITVSSTTNGTVTVTPTSAKSGSKVTITTTPNSGYKVSSITVKDSSGNIISVTNNGDSTYIFTMPDDPVTVSVSFASTGGGGGGGNGAGSGTSSSSSSSSYQIIASTTENGSVTIAPKSAKSGEKVSITATPNDGYTTGSVTVTDRSGNSISVTDNGDGTYTFTMPASQVTVSATFVAIEIQIPWVNPFTDVSESDWFYDEVTYVVQNGLMNGVGNGQFNPRGTTTRGMIMTILARQGGLDTSGSSPWYQMGMEWAMQAGVSDGTGPEVDITREQLATMLWRYAGEPAATGDLSDYPDAIEVHDWANNAMIWAVENGIIGGSDGKLNPQGNALRSEAAAMLTRFCKNIER